MDPVGSQPYGDEDPLPIFRTPSRPLRASDFVEDEALEDDMEEDSGDEGEQPDLGEYFSQWDISPKEQILMCRSYASYLSALKKPFKKAEEK